MIFTLSSLYSTFNRFDEINDSGLYSGFYTYHINTNTWNLLYVDVNHQLAANPEFHSIKVRTMHAMLFDDVSEKEEELCFMLSMMLFYPFEGFFYSITTSFNLIHGKAQFISKCNFSSPFQTE